MTPLSRPLTGTVVNVSISESDDTTQHGFPPWQVNRVTLQIVAALYGQGAAVVFGHDWREDGVMAAVYGLAREMQPPVPFPPMDDPNDTISPPLKNVLPWPDKPYLADADLRQLNATLRVESAGLPEELHRFDEEAQRSGADSRIYKYLRARGLTLLRHRLTASSHARICLGGRRTRSAGRYPGVVEEALLALRAGKPLFLAAVLGGATAQLLNAVEGRDMPDDFCRPTELQSIYANPPIPEASSETSPDRMIDRSALWQEFSRAGYEALARTNGLTIDENSEVGRTPVLDRVIELVLTGLSRVRSR